MAIDTEKNIRAAYDNDYLRVGIVGYGKMGRIRKHAIDKVSHVKIVGVFDPELIGLNSQDGLKVFQSIDDLFLADVHAIFIAGYVSTLAETTIKALAHKIHVFCEKPPAMNLKQLMTVKEKLHGTNLKLKYGFNHRYHSSVMKAKELIETDQIGDVIFFRAVYGKAGSLDFEKNWRNYAKYSGGGILIDQGIHMIDLLNYFLGKINVKHALVKTLHWNVEVEDNVMALFESESGAIGSIHSSATQWDHRFLLELYGKKGHIILDGILSSTMSYAPERLIFSRRLTENVQVSMGHPVTEEYVFDADFSWITEVEEFVNSIRNDSDISHGTVDQAMQIMSLLEEIYSY